MVLTSASNGRTGAGAGRSRRPNDRAFIALVDRYHEPLTRLAARRGAIDSEGVALLALAEVWEADRTRPDEPGGIADVETRLDRAIGRLTTSEQAGSLADAVHLPDDAEIVSRPDLDDERPTGLAARSDALVVDDPARSLTEAAWLHQLVDELPPDQRDVIRLRFFEELPAKEVGERLDKEANAVYQLQHRGVARLRRAVELERVAAGALTRKVTFLAAIVAVAVVLGALGWYRVRGGEGPIDVGPIGRGADSGEPIDEGPVGDGREADDQAGNEGTGGRAVTDDDPTDGDRAGDDAGDGDMINGASGNGDGDTVGLRPGPGAPVPVGSPATGGVDDLPIEPDQAGVAATRAGPDDGAAPSAADDGHPVGPLGNGPPGFAEWGSGSDGADRVPPGLERAAEVRAQPDRE